MDSASESHKQSAEWLRPRTEQRGLRRYTRTVRERIWLVVAVVVVTMGVTAVYVKTTSKVFQAETDLLITPVAREDTDLSGLSLLRESNEPTREVESAARLVATRSVADEVRAKLKLRKSPRALLESVSAEPVAGSSILAVTASGDTPEQARDVANAFGEIAIKQRTRVLHRQLDGKIRSLRARIKRLPSERAAGEPTGRSNLREQQARLETLRAGNDPTMQIVTAAALPDRQASPRPVLSLAAALVGGLILGISGAFVAQALDPRIRREEQVRDLYRLPILARIPTEKRLSSRKKLVPANLSPVTLEAYRTLRATLTAFPRGGSGPRSILVTGSSPGEGKTMTAVLLAYTLALAGHSVILIEADFRRPSVGRVIGLGTTHGLTSVLLHDLPLSRALVDSPDFGPRLRFLLSGDPAIGIDELLALPATQTLFDQTEAMADYVIVDSPPLAEVTDALPIAQRVDSVVIVARVGRTRLDKLAQLGELLAQHDIKPAGFAVVGVGRAAARGYGYYTGHVPDAAIPLAPADQAERSAGPAPG